MFWFSVGRPNTPPWSWASMVRQLPWGSMPEPLGGVFRPARQGVSRPLSERLKGRAEAVILPSAPRNRSLFFRIVGSLCKVPLSLLTAHLGARACLSGNAAIVQEISTRKVI